MWVFNKIIVSPRNSVKRIREKNQLKLKLPYKHHQYLWRLMLDSLESFIRALFNKQLEKLTWCNTVQLTVLGIATISILVFQQQAVDYFWKRVYNYKHKKLCFVTKLMNCYKKIYIYLKICSWPKLPHNLRVLNNVIGSEICW